MKTKIFLSIFTSLLLLSGCNSNTPTEDSSKESKENTKVEETENKTTEQEVSIEDIDFSSLPQFEEVKEEDLLVTLNTARGPIKIKLFPKYAPKAVENFTKLSEKGYYDGLTFHRVMEDFMIQGGDPNGNGTGGESIYGKPFEDEFSPVLFNVRGALSMANSGPNTNGSQFFIVQNSKVEDSLIKQMQEVGYPEEIITKYQEHGGTPWLDGVHTVFGQVVEGMDIVDSISSKEVDENAKPLEDIVIKSVSIENK